MNKVELRSIIRPWLEKVQNTKDLKPLRKSLLVDKLKTLVEESEEQTNSQLLLKFKELEKDIFSIPQFKKVREDIWRRLLFLKIRIERHELQSEGS